MGIVVLHIAVDRAMKSTLMHVVIERDERWGSSDLNCTTRARAVLGDTCISREFGRYRYLYLEMARLISLKDLFQLPSVPLF